MNYKTLQIRNVWKMDKLHSLLLSVFVLGVEKHTSLRDHPYVIYPSRQVKTSQDQSRWVKTSQENSRQVSFSNLIKNVLNINKPLWNFAATHSIPPGPNHIKLLWHNLHLSKTSQWILLPMSLGSLPNTLYHELQD